MPNNITFKFTWCKEFQKNIPKGYFVIKPEKIFYRPMAVYLNNLEAYQKERGMLKEQKAKFEWFYRKRTDLQNSLYWSLREIQANELNAGKRGKNMITSEQLHEDYLREYGEREIIITQRKNLNKYLLETRVEFVILEKEKIPVSTFLEMEKNYDDSEMIKIQTIRGTSGMNTKEMAIVIESVFDEIWESGVEESGDIHNYWVEWRQFLNDNKITLHDDIMSMAEYKERRKMCEACGDKPGEHLAHIKAIGMGGKEELEKNYASNWLHLCERCHIGIWHNQGVKSFLDAFPHLKYKVSTALKREYKEIDEDERSDVLKEENVDTYAGTAENAEDTTPVDELDIF